MISPQQIQERRRDELLRRQLGPQLLAAIADPAITDIIVNEDGRVSSLVQEAGVPPQPELIAETIDLIAFIVRTPEGRKVTELVRVKSYDAREGFRLETA
jgi:Flp pilus assembly CpaF family ATPase